MADFQSRVYAGLSSLSITKPLEHRMKPFLGGNCDPNRNSVRAAGFYRATVPRRGRQRWVDSQTSLIHNGIIDSLGVLEIVTFVEQRFHVVMSDDEMVSEHFESVQSLANLINAKLPRDSSCSA